MGVATRLRQRTRGLLWGDAENRVALFVCASGEAMRRVGLFLMLVLLQAPSQRGWNVQVPLTVADEPNLFSPNPAIDPGDYYAPGAGRPAISTADYYHLDGLYWFRPYDMLQFGAPGEAIAAARGRYFWIATPDHPDGNYTWPNGTDFMGGYSDDPGKPPKSLYLLFRYNNSINLSGDIFNLYQAAQLVYNPDDATYPFYLYAEGNNLSGTSIQHEQGLARSTDLLTWVMFGTTHENETFADWSSFQMVKRISAGVWTSRGLLVQDDVNSSTFGQGVWTSADGQTFLHDSDHAVDVIGDRYFEMGPSDEFDIDGVTWLFVREKDNGDGVQHCTMAAYDSDYNVLASPAPIRIVSYGVGDDEYPGPGFLQTVAAYYEDGIAHIYLTRGFATSSAAFGTVNGEIFASGGGLWEQFVDYRTRIIDADAAALAAPVGVSASCDGGMVTLEWFDALPHTNYRVYRGSSAGTQATLIGDVDGITTTDSPTADQQWWYKVVTMESGVERGYRVVRVYVSAEVLLVNEHIDRVIQEGGDEATIDVAWLVDVVEWLDSEGLTNNLLFWTDPSFGVIKDGSNIISKVFDLGCTRLPRGGDYTPTTSATTYNATGLNSTAPAWVNANTNSFGRYGSGRINNIRRKTQITVVGVYSKSNTNKATLLAMDENGGMGLAHTSGTPGDASFWLADAGGTVTATATMGAATGAHIIAGTFDGTHVKAYADGVAGSGQTGFSAALGPAYNALLGTRGSPNEVPFLGSGSTSSKYLVNTSSYSFSSNEAQFSASAFIVFDVALTAPQMASLMTLLETRNGL